MAINTSQKRSRRTQEKEAALMTYATGSDGSIIKRVPQSKITDHDVLSGRGGSINAHPGNIQFRDWVKVRKNDYNLAPSKTEKARVAREVIALVQGLDPPGRFLQRDPSSSGAGGWWIELDDERIMAKTSQALREGAPQIRAAHKDVLDEQRTKKRHQGRKQRTTKDGYEEQETSGAKRTHAEMSTNWPLAPISTNGNFRIGEQHSDGAPADQQFFEHPGARLRVEYNRHVVNPHDETPPLAPSPSPPGDQMDYLSLSHDDDYPRLPIPHRPESAMRRSHSLALSELSSPDWDAEEFVNPFEDESDLEWHKPFIPPRLGVLRESSVTSNGDMGGLKSLLHSDHSNRSLSSNSSGVRSSHYSNVASNRLAINPLLPDLPGRDMTDSDVNEAMQRMYRELHEDNNNNANSDSVMRSDYNSDKPFRAFRGGSYRLFRRPSVSRAFDGRQ